MMFPHCIAPAMIYNSPVYSSRTHYDKHQYISLIRVEELSDHLSELLFI
jgi:hypothetical protein